MIDDLRYLSHVKIHCIDDIIFADEFAMFKMLNEPKFVSESLILPS